MAFNDDSILAELLELGFEYSLCQQAVERCENLEAATEWILDALEEKQQQATTPILSIGTTSAPLHRSEVSLERSGVSEVLSLHSRHNKEAEKAKFRNSREQAEKMSQEAKKRKLQEKEARARTLQQISEDREKRHLIHPNVPHISPAPVNQIRMTQAGHVSTEQAQQRQLEKEARQRTLIDIKNDREKQRLKSQKKAEEITEKEPQQAVIGEGKTTEFGQSKKDENAFVQVRLSNGQIIRQNFSAVATIADVLAFVRDNETVEFQLVMAFPRRIFDETNQYLTMRDAGFVPNCSLNVLKKSATEPFIAPSCPQNPIADLDDVQLLQASNQNLSPAISNEEEDQIMYEVSEDESDREDENDREDEIDQDEIDHDEIDQEEDFDIDQPALPPPLHLGQIHALPMPNFQRHTNNFGGPRRMIPFFSGTGMRLDNGNEDRDSSVTQEPLEVRMQLSRETLAAGFESRLQAQSTTSDNSKKPVKHPLKSLRDIGANAVTMLLNSPTTTAKFHLKHVGLVSSHVAEQLLQNLIRNKTLAPPSFSRLANSCYIQTICLDHYIYATDSLLEAIGISGTAVSLQRISCRGCEFVTDGGINALMGCKNLEELDVGNCKVTDKAVKTLAKFKYLEVLNLSKTKITIRGLKTFAETSLALNGLKMLSLEGCPGVTGTEIFCILTPFKSLSKLLLTSTAITTPLIPPSANAFSNLEILDLSRTSVGDVDMKRIICGLTSLRELKLNACMGVSIEGLKWISRELKNLEEISFPDREENLDNVLGTFKSISLVHLDLTGFLNITDISCTAISQMNQLEFLSLIGTKITDEGGAQLGNLLELKQLFLDRTALTDAGLTNLKSLPRLNTLSLISTAITDTFLILIGDSQRCEFTRNLKSLNLSGCSKVTDEGVQALSGINKLTNLNLDFTGVSRSCLHFLKELPDLLPVRLMGITKEFNDDSSGRIHPFHE